MSHPSCIRFTGTASHPGTATTAATDTGGGVVARLLRRAAVILVAGVCAVVALPGIAQAHVAPLGPDSDVAPAAGPAPHPAAISHAYSPDRGLTTVLALLVIGLLAAALVVLARRVIRHRRGGYRSALSV